MSPRTYSEDEIALLMERAAELQAQQSKTAKKSGLTLDELQDIASEAGLDPEMLRLAASELDEPERALYRSGSGTTKTHNHVERWIPGELTEEVVEEVVMELKHRYDSAIGASMGMPYYGQGLVEQIGRSVEWRHTSSSGVETRVLLRPRGEGVQIRLSQRVGMAGTKAESTFLGAIAAFIAGGVGGGVLDSTGYGIIIFLASFAIFSMLIAFLDVKWRQKKHRQLHALGDDLAEIAANLQPEHADHEGSLESAARTTEAEPRIELELDEVPAEADRRRSRDRA